MNKIFNMRKSINTKLNFLFYILLFLTLVISCLPKNYVMAVYTPNILGYVFLVFMLAIVLLFIYLFFTDIMLNKYRQILTRTVVIGVGIFIYYVFRNV